MSTPPRSGEPPRRWLAVLDRLLPADEAAHLRVELEALYDVRLRRDGRAAADAWLRRQVLAFAPAAAATLLRGAARSVGDAALDAIRGARALARAPAHTGVVVATLTVGIGASALMFTLVDGVLLRPLPFREPDRLVEVWAGMSPGELGVIRERTRSLAAVAAYQSADGVNLEHDGEAFRISATFVQPGLFDMLGAQPRIGRLFAAEEAEPGRAQVALLSEGLWVSMFAADPGILGRAITLDGRAYRVVGVLPSEWSFPHPADRVWLPLAWDPGQPGPFWGNAGLHAVGRLAPGASVGSAQAELRDLSADLSAANPLWTPRPDYRSQAEVAPLRDALVESAKPTLLVLLAAVGMVVLVVCANVSSMLVARALERGRSSAVRRALGASPARVVRESLVESALLGLTGSLLGVAAAHAGLDLLRPALVGRVPRAEELSVDARVLAVVIALGVLTGLASGIAPALRSARSDPHEALRAGARGGTAGARRRRLSELLVTTQVAAAVVLVTSAMLLLRTLAAIGAVDVGFRAGDLVTAAVTFPSTYEEEAAAHAYDALLARLRAAPGVGDAALAASLPFGQFQESWATFVEDVTTDPNLLPVIDAQRVGSGYFRVMGIPVLEGRAFTDADRAGAPLVVVVDEQMAREYWPGASALGKRIHYPWADAPWMEVVGVVGSVADHDLTAPRRPRWYLPLAQRPAPNIHVVIASDLPGAAVVPAVRAAVSEVDDRLPVSEAAEYGDLIGESAAATRLTARVLAAFALVTLLLGCLGVYGVAAHAVRERRREIGLRMALGARAATVAAKIAREGAIPTGTGAALGLLAAAATTRALSGMLFGVTPLDPITFASVPIVMVVVGALAVWVPARRAARIDPVDSLREA